MINQIIVDADASPVKNEVIRIGKEFNVSVILVASFAHFMSDIEGAKLIYVDKSDQSVDLYIANLVKRGDLIVTDDYGLAALLLKPGVRVISSRGSEYTEQNISALLSKRHESAKLRRSGHKTKGPKPFTNDTREKFVENLRKILQK